MYVCICVMVSALKYVPKFLIILICTIAYNSAHVNICGIRTYVCDCGMLIEVVTLYVYTYMCICICTYMLFV